MVVTGKADLAAPGGQHLDIRAIVTHPQFVHTRLLMTDDVAVVLLQTPTTAPSAIRSTSTPQLGSGTVYGWGALDAAKTLFPPTLQTASLAIQPPSSCTNFFASAICA